MFGRKKISATKRGQIFKFGDCVLEDSKWNYFVTLMIDTSWFVKCDDDKIKMFLNSLSRNIQCFDANADMLLVPERSPNGALHFHGFVLINEPFELVPFVLNDKQLNSAVGTPLYKFPFWGFGPASCSKIDGENSSNDYCSKYLGRSIKVGPSLRNYIEINGGLYPIEYNSDVYKKNK